MFGGSVGGDGQGPASPAGFPYWSMRGPQIGGLYTERILSTDRKPETKNVAATTMTNAATTATLGRLLTKRRYIALERLTMGVMGHC